MAKAQPPETKRAVPRLYLATPLVGETSDFVAMLTGAFEAADVAAVLLRLAPDSERTLINRIKTLAAVVQPKGVALLLDGHAGLTARSGADGAHLTGVETFVTEVETLKPERIAGCGGLQTRHDAMLAAERGADYVMFGEPDGSGRRPSFEAVIERIEWWAEVFEIPCVGFAASADEVAALARVGADFVAVGGAIWDRGVVAAITEAAACLDQREVTP